jgi:hypothetical protein
MSTSSKLCFRDGCVAIICVVGSDSLFEDVTIKLLRPLDDVRLTEDFVINVIGVGLDSFRSTRRIFCVGRA